ncbi:EAL domain-containing protein [Breoghania sp. L-A4]|uniref:EAL domain-containing response regulator n=1 Tax=Breoghania sp. L-A4 TaxID=2304600 RepID=UPI000E359C5E|nr:EAL domain-containing protein [Breoghania sp. L-A4]AXS38783.1 EAL domain-containing protein [Breoghania sp. L-A4]
MSLIVIVDDQPTNRQIFTKIAASIDSAIEVKCFADPQLALDWLDDNTPDLLITDYNMPHMDGAEFISRLRQRPSLRDIPIIVITVFEDRAYRIAALDAGATDFLQSPVDHREFVTRARNLLKLRQQQLLLANRAASLKQELEDSERELQRTVRDSSERLAQVIDTVPALISASDCDGRFLFLNAYYNQITGIDAGKAVGRDTAEILGAEAGNRNKTLDRMVIEGEKPLNSYEEEIVDRTGRRRVFLTTKSPLRDAGNRITGILTSSLDITDRKAAESHLHFIAHHDALTELPNRTMLREQLGLQIARSRRGDRQFALHLIDLDDFKNVNDVLGHSAGDNILIEVAKRLMAIRRKGDVIARLGGDEFAVLQTGITCSKDAAIYAGEIGATIAQPHSVSGQKIETTASIGVVMHPADGYDFEEMLRHADLAMYQAKADGGNQHRFYATDMNTLARRAVALDTELRKAIECEEFILYYQPQVDIKSGAFVGVEALLRWRTSTGEIIGPAGFLPRAEENGMIVPINEWVLREACSQAVAWQNMGLPPLRMGVNLSPVQFRKQSVPLLVARVLADTGLDPRMLDLELTENIVMQNTESVAVQLGQLRELGVVISIDDFGTGFSSLSYIKHFPIDRLKIDQSFVRDLMTDPSDAAIVQAIISLGANLKLDVIAEGVETPEQLEHLRKAGCLEAQGYYFGRPMPACELEELVCTRPSVARKQ